MKLDLTNLGWQALVFKQKDLVNGPFLTTVSMASAAVGTFTRSSQRHLSFPG